MFHDWLNVSGHSLLSIEKRHFLKVSQLLLSLVVAISFTIKLVNLAFVFRKNCRNPPLDE